MPQMTGPATSTCSSRRHLHRGSACNNGLIVDWPLPTTSTNGSSSGGSLPQSADDSDCRRPAAIFHRQDQRRDGCGNNHQVDGPDDVQQRLASMTMMTRGGEESAAAASTIQKKQERGSDSITFSRDVRVKVIPPRSEYTSERIWYTKEEFAAQSKECALVAKEMRRLRRKGKKQDPNQAYGSSSSAQQQCPNSDTTFRGLEHLYSKGIYARRHDEQRRNINAVLMAQENDFTPDDIAAIYARQCRQSKTRALSLGEMDAEEAGVIHKAGRRSSY